MNIILESELKITQLRKIGKNPYKFLSMNVIPNGSFVSIGYINDHVIKKQMSVNAADDEQLTAYIESLPNSKFRDHLISFQNSPKYQNALAGKGKQAPFNISGDTHIIKLGRFIVNWRDNQAFAKFYGDRGEAEQRVRANHGFGYADEDYPEDDWRRKYGGVGVNRRLKRNTGNQYIPLSDGNAPGFYVYGGENEDIKKIEREQRKDRLAIRQIANPKSSPDPIWLFVDADGHIEYLDNKLMSWLTYAYKRPVAAKEVEVINQEEQEFLNDLKNIKNWGRPEKTMLLDNILYFVGTTVDSAKNKQAFCWLNDDRILELYPYLSNEDKLEEIIDKCIDRSKMEVADVNEDMQVVINKGRLLESQQALKGVKFYTREDFIKKPAKRIITLNEREKLARRRALNEKQRITRRRTLNENRIMRRNSSIRPKRF